jgi:hypothetical protein
MVDLGRELISIAKAGLLRLGAVDGAALLEPLEQIVAERRSYADVIAAEYRRVDGDVAKLIEFLRLR